jgi:complement component 1 Q subcomponent-binding protein
MTIAQGILRKCAGAVSRSNSLLTPPLLGTARFALVSWSGNIPCANGVTSKAVAESAHIQAARQCRLFSSEAKSTLVDILAREEKEERDMGNTEMPPELADLKATVEKDWKVVEDGATTSMFRSMGSQKIQLSFHCQDTIEEVSDDYEEEGDEEEEDPSPVRFTVTITKTGKTLTFACFSDYGQVRVEGVSTTTTSPEVVHSNQGTLAKTEYQGPDYSELPEDLQQAMEVYLDEECGVNSDVAAFIAMYTDYREEMNYVDFLKVTQSIIS